MNIFKLQIRNHCPIKSKAISKPYKKRDLASAKMSEYNTSLMGNSSGQVPYLSLCEDDI